MNVMEIELGMIVGILILIGCELSSIKELIKNPIENE